MAPPFHQRLASGAGKIAASILLGLLVQAGTIIWWAGKLEQRVFVLEEWRSGNNQVLTRMSDVEVRVTRVEEKTNFIKEQGTRIENKLDTVIDRRRP